MTNPYLTNFSTLFIFGENAVNDSPQLLDIDVTFTDADDDFDGGRLSLTGLLAEDTVSVNDQGAGAGQIGLSGANVTYGGVIIGTLAGGTGTDLTITFNANATSASIDALIENLTYANSSNAPTTSRDFVLNVTDSAGNGLVFDATFAALTGADNPFDGIDVDSFSAPDFVDIDGDGDLDLVIGTVDGTLLTYRNGTDTASGAFTMLTGTDNPFESINVGLESAPVFADIDGDGDLDLVVGDYSGELATYRNGTDTASGAFVALTGSDNPFNGVVVGAYSAPSFTDIDGDGDFDLVIGTGLGTLITYRNGTDTASGAFTVLTGTDNPFDGIDVGLASVPTFTDIDGDGDLDLVVGAYNGTLVTYRNGTETTSGAFTQLTGGDNPFDGIDVGYDGSPSFVDIDGDGDLDLVVGERYGTLVSFENTTLDGIGFTITVTPEDEAPELTGLDSVTFAENSVNTAPQLLDIDVTFTGGDNDFDGGTLTLTGILAEDTVSVNNQGFGAGQIGLIDANVTYGGVIIGTLAGGAGAALTITFNAAATSESIEALIENLTYANSSNTPTISRDLFLNVTDSAGAGLSLDDGVDGIGLTITVTPEDEVPELTGLDSVTFAENSVNAAPQLLDVDVIFTGGDNDFNGGTLTLTGILAEDTVSVNNQGFGAGQISLIDANVTYGGVIIGTLAGGAGAALTITFTADATSASIEALIENLTYANSSDTPTISRDFVLNVTDSAGAMTISAAFTALTGTDNPFDGIDVGLSSAPTFTDIDGDGDLDLVVGALSGELVTYRNGTDGASGAFTALTGTDNPFDGIDVGLSSVPTFTDIDGDGDLDLVMGERSGTLVTFRNGTDGASGAFTALTGTDNPFDGIDVGLVSRPSFVDIDGDGDLDLVMGERDGTLVTFRNGTDGASGAFSALTGTDNPFDGIDVGQLSTPNFVDLDGDGDLDLVVGSEDGTLLTYLNGTDTTSGAFTMLTGTDNPFYAIDVGIRSTPTFVDLDGDGDLDLVVGSVDGLLVSYENTIFTITVTPEYDALELRGLDSSATFSENSVNAAPQRLDVDVIFTGGDNDFDGGRLTLTGLLAEDTVSVNNQGISPGQIGLSGANVTYGGVIIGTLAGGAGAALTITFTADATSDSIDALIENLTYANSSDAPTISRDLFINVTNSVGLDLIAGNDTYAALTGTDNPFNGIDVGVFSTPSFTDFDGDGDLDLVVGTEDGTLVTYRNGTDGAAGAFTALTGTDNPFDGIDVGYHNAPTFVDIDGDGDLDLVMGAFSGKLVTYRNGTDGAAGAFTALTGTDNPFNGIDAGYFSNPSFVDIDGDGDLDLVVGVQDGTLLTYRNGTGINSGAFTALTGSDNPFDGIDVGTYSAPSFVDIDGDGDLDLVVGTQDGALLTYRNGTESTSGAFTALTGPDNPFDGIDTGYYSTPSFVDIDGDGDIDLVVGGNYGTLVSYENITLDSIGFTITVTPEDEAPELMGLDSVTFAENSVNTAPQLLDIDVTFTGGDNDFDGGTLTLTGILAEDTVSVNNQGIGAGQISLSGTNVTYGGVTIGSLAGGVGAPLTITFNGAATSASIEALIENLTYANSSDAPTISRDFVLNVTDSAGAMTISNVFAALTGTDNPFDGIDVGFFSRPSFVDIDGDGDLDLVVGHYDGTLVTFRNGTDTASGAFTALTGTDNPFDGIDAGYFSTPSFVDIDGDGDLDLVVGDYSGELVTYRNGTDGAAGAFTALTGTDNPFDGVDVGAYSAPSFVDLDGDGDLDLVVGHYDGTLLTYRNGTDTASGAFTALTGADNPFNGIDAGYLSDPSFVDIDGDGDLDLVVGDYFGALVTYRNGTDTASGAFTALTGADNPFDGIDVGFFSTPSFVDLDGDGDLDLVVGERYGTLVSFENTTLDGIGFTITVTPENDVPVLTGLDSVTFAENAVNAAPQRLDMDVTFTDAEGNFSMAALTLTGLLAEDTVSVNDQGIGPGQISLSGANISYGGVIIGTLAGGAGAALTITFYATATSASIEALIENLTYANSSDTPTISRDLFLNVTDSAGADLSLDDSVDGIGFTITVTPEDEAPELTGLDSVTFAENSVNTAPQLLDIDVTFTGEDNDFDGGALTLTGILAEDTVSVNNQGFGAGQISLSGANVSYGGIIIGTFAGGAGAALTITFTADATSASIEALIENLTYANSSDAPTISRDFVLNVTDSAGNGLVFDATFAALTGADNPFDGIDAGYFSTPSFVDIDGDGDLDLVVGDYSGELVTYRNGTDGASGAFTALTGTDNPFDGVDVGAYSAPSFVDLDGDGDLDLVMGERSGTLVTFRNGTDGASGAFTALTGTNSPFDGIDVGDFSAPSFTDIDGDGDFDLVIGTGLGTLITYRNGTDTASGAFTVLTGTDNPFDGIDVGLAIVPTFTDIDGDGDFDLVIGTGLGTLITYRNGTDTASGAFTALTGTDNPFDGIDVGYDGSPSFVDLDGDGDLDLVVGTEDGLFVSYENTMFTITVTPEYDAFELTDLPASVSVTEDMASDLDLSALTLSDPDMTDVLTVTLSTSAGTMTAVNGNDVTVTGVGSSALTLVGTAAAIDAYLNTASAVQYTGAQDASGIAAATLNLTGDDGSGVVLLGTVNIDITEVVDILTGTPDSDTLTGTDGDDELYGLGADDSLFGGDGDDILIGGAGGDALDGGDGIDTASYTDSTNRVDVSLLAGTAVGGQATGDVLTNIEGLSGSNFGDTLRGDFENNILSGNGGNDVLIGLDGNDQIFGGDGRDIITGGDGADIIDGGGGIDQARYNNSSEGVQIDLLAGTTSGGQAEGDVLTRIENLFGSTHNDTLFGDGNNNKIFGNDGDDALAAGGGISKLFGGAGADTFVLSDGFGYVMDLVDDVDQIDVSDYGFATLTDALLNLDQVGAHARFRFDGDVLLILNTDVNDLMDDIVI